LNKNQKNFIGSVVVVVVAVVVVAATAATSGTTLMRVLGETLCNHTSTRRFDNIEVERRIALCLEPSSKSCGRDPCLDNNNNNNNNNKVNKNLPIMRIGLACVVAGEKASAALSHNDGAGLDDLAAVFLHTQVLSKRDENEPISFHNHQGARRYTLTFGFESRPFLVEPPAFFVAVRMKIA
jgi:hypothetical protein